MLRTLKTGWELEVISKSKRETANEVFNYSAPGSHTKWSGQR